MLLLLPVRIRQLQRLAWSHRTSSSARVMVDRSPPGRWPAPRPARSGCGTCARAAQRRLGVDLEVPGDVHDREEQVAELVLVSDRPPRPWPPQLGELLGDLGQDAVDVVPIEADRGGLSLHLVRVQQRGEIAGHAVHHARATLLRLLDLLPVATHRSALSASTSPKTWGWRRTSLSWIPRATSARVNHRPPPRASRGRRPGTAGRRAPPRGGRSSSGDRRGVDRFEHLVGLLEQVASERGGSARGPTGTARAACARARRNAPARPRPAPASVGIQSDVRWSGSNDRSRSSHATSSDLLVGQPEVVEHDDRRAAVVLDRELDVGQDLGCRIARRPAGRAPRRPRPRTVAVDQAHSGRERVDPEPVPHEVEERERRHDSTTTRSSPRSSSTVRSATSGEPGTA